jgi:hypothetical protein
MLSEGSDLKSGSNGALCMGIKSKGMGLGIALGTALGVVLGLMAGHIGLWLGIGMAVGIAIGTTMRRSTCAHCEAEKQNQQSRATARSS